MVITPQVANSYKTEYHAKPFQGYQLMIVQSIIAYNALQGMSWAFIDKMEENVASQLEAAGFRLDRTSTTKDHISW